MRIKRIFVTILTLCLLFSVCSCSDFEFRDMESYLKSNTDVKVKSINEWIYNADSKSIAIQISLSSGSEPSLEELDKLRKLLNEYMQKEDGYLSQGWQVSVLVDEYTIGTQEPRKYAVFANFKEGYIAGDGEYRFETSDYLNTFWFCFEPDDISYISSLTDVEHILLGGKYSETDSDLIYNTIEEVRELDNLKSISLYPYWYDSFVSAGLECEIVEVQDSHHGLLIP